MQIHCASLLFANHNVCKQVDLPRGNAGYENEWLVEELPNYFFTELFLSVFCTGVVGSLFVAKVRLLKKILGLISCGEGKKIAFS